MAAASITVCVVVVGVLLAVFLKGIGGNGGGGGGSTWFTATSMSAPRPTSSLEGLRRWRQSLSPYVRTGERRGLVRSPWHSCGRLGLLSGVSCTSNSESHVDEGSPLLVSVLGGTRLSLVHSHRAAAAAVVHDEEESRSRRIQSSPR